MENQSWERTNMWYQRTVSGEFAVKATIDLRAFTGHKERLSMLLVR
jgi:hypothetical protein